MLVLDLITLAFCLIISALWGIFVVRKTIINILISLELLLLGISFLFIVFSLYLDDIVGQIFALLILTVAGSESAIGLAILLSFYRARGDISISDTNLVKG